MLANKNMSLRQLELFTIVAYERNFTKAAKKIGMTQPALSIAIRQIEEKLNTKLLSRNAHTVTLTKAGDRFLPQAERLLEIARHAFKDMHADLVGQKPKLRIGVPPSIMARFATILQKMKKNNFPSDFTVIDGPAEYLTRQLQTGKLDIAFSILTEPHPDLVQTVLFHDEIILLTHHMHKLAANNSIEWGALKDEEIVAFQRGSARQLSEVIVKHHQMALSTIYEIDTLASIYGLVQADLAVALIPRLYTLGMKTQNIKIITLENPTIKRAMTLLRHPDKIISNPNIIACYDFISNEFHKGTKTR